MPLRSKSIRRRLRRPKALRYYGDKRPGAAGAARAERGTLTLHPPHSLPARRSPRSPLLAHSTPHHDQHRHTHRRRRSTRPAPAAPSATAPSRRRQRQRQRCPRLWRGQRSPGEPRISQAPVPCNWVHPRAALTPPPACNAQSPAEEIIAIYRRAFGGLPPPEDQATAGAPQAARRACCSTCCALGISNRSALGRTLGPCPHHRRETAAMRFNHLDPPAPLRLLSLQASVAQRHPAAVHHARAAAGGNRAGARAATRHTAPRRHHAAASAARAALAAAPRGRGGRSGLAAPPSLLRGCRTAPRVRAGARQPLHK